MLDPARDVGPDDEITLDGYRVGADPVRRVVYALNKPAGVVSTASDPQRRPTVVALVSDPAPVSRSAVWTPTPPA